ncbi:TPA: TraV family lipoprotein [Legionella anisa]
MNQLIRILLLATVSILTGCSSMNSQFSCNKTAGDGCLSMEEVNAMTEGGSIQVIRRTPVTPVPLLKVKTRRVWIAPYVDNNKVKHQGELVYVPEIHEGETA